MEQKLTCGNHADEDVILYQIGWNSFSCPKCGKDYSIGRKVVALERATVRRHHVAQGA